MNNKRRILCCSHKSGIRVNWRWWLFLFMKPVAGPTYYCNIDLLTKAGSPATWTKGNLHNIIFIVVLPLSYHNWVTWIIVLNACRFNSEYAAVKLLKALDWSSFRPEQNKAMPASRPVPKSHSSIAILAYVITGCSSDKILSFSFWLVAACSLMNSFFIVAANELICR